MFSLTSGIPNYYTDLRSKMHRLLDHSNKFLAKINSNKMTSKENYRSVPAKATVRSEYIKCGKSNCCYCPHGPYYYAYWKDEFGKLKKKYVVTRYEETWK